MRSTRLCVGLSCFIWCRQPARGRPRSTEGAAQAGAGRISRARQGVYYLRVDSAAQFCSTVTPASVSAACQAGIPSTISKPAVVLLATKYACGGGAERPPKQHFVDGTRVPADRSKDHLWIVGGGIAGMAAAAFAIRDARVPANQVHFLEMLGIEGGSLDGGRTPNNKGAWVTRGARMLTEELNQCTWDLCDSIPSLEDPSISVLQESGQFIPEPG